MILLDGVIEILNLADFDQRPVLLVVVLNGRGVGLTAIDRDLLWHPVAADRLGEEAHGGSLIALGCQQEVKGLATFIYRPIQIVPLALDPDVRFIHPPAVTHQPLAAPIAGCTSGPND